MVQPPTSITAHAVIDQPLPSITTNPNARRDRLKQELDENLVVFGSGVLVRSLMRGNLVDEFVLLIHPLVLGSGRHLFSNSGSNPCAFELVGSATTGTGVIIATYQPAGS